MDPAAPPASSAPAATSAVELVCWLIQLGFPRELIDDGLRIVADELDHAELSAEVCLAAGAPVTPALDPRSLSLPRHVDGLLPSALGATLRCFCLGETVAVPLFRELRSQCAEPTARTALDRILRDEVRHRQFGWDLLEYFVDHVPGSRERATAFLPELLAELRATYGRGGEGASETVGAAERAWGLMPPAAYRTILEQTVSDEYLPRFSALGIAVPEAEG
jgi:hypothetical protein